MDSDRLRFGQRPQRDCRHAADLFAFGAGSPHHLSQVGKPITRSSRGFLLTPADVSPLPEATSF